MAQKTLAELRLDKMAADIAAIAKDQATTMRLVAEIHAHVVLNKPEISSSAKIKKACDEMVRGNFIPMKVLSGKKAVSNERH
jgi:hypothetical protein